MDSKGLRWKSIAISAVIGLLCGAGIGAVWSSKVVWGIAFPWLRSEHRRLYDAYERQKVICAGRGLKAGRILVIEDLAVVGVVRSTAAFSRLIEPDELESVLGRRLRYDLVEAEPLLWTDLDGAARSNAPSARQRLVSP